MNRLRVLGSVIGCFVISWATYPLAQSAAAEARQDAADVARFVEVLQVRPGAVVADIGAGSGRLSVLFSPIVGSAGRVFATDVNKDRLRDITAAVGKAAVTNVTVVEGGASNTNLSDTCCNAIFMRHVYHHIGDPPLMNQSLLQSLKPGGRLAITDFKPKSGKSAAPGKRGEGDNHGVMPATIIEELKAAGFENVREEPWTEPHGFLIVAEKKR